MEPLFGVLFSLFKGQPVRGQWIVACLEGAWPKLLGERLAAVCRPARFEDANLRIEVLDLGWEQVLRSVKSDLQEKLRIATANEVRTISFSRHSLAAGL